MFLKIKLRETDRDAQRFLWRGSNRSMTPDEYVVNSVLFGAKSSPCIALHIKNKNANRFMSKYPDTVKSLIDNCYMDDLLDSCESINEASERVAQAIEINASAGWEMHSWASNEPSVFKNIITTTETKKLLKNESDVYGEKVLGLKWENMTDVLTFSVNSCKISDELYSGRKKPTKREFLAIIMSVFNPLGFLTPFTIRSRIIMQQIWASKVGWDDEIRESEFLSWLQWLRELKAISDCRVVRCYQLKEKQVLSTELHVFCDASSKACAAVAYWRFVLPNNHFHISLIIAKSRVSPTKVITIPRLELQAALLATRLATIILNEHRLTVTQKFFWSDSKIVLNWIKREPKDFKIFVANRLAEIRENSNCTEWKWIPTLENPADDGTRTASNALKTGSRWLSGPSFLRENETHWPKEKNQFTDFHTESQQELKQQAVICVTTIKVLEIDFSRFSSWSRLIATIIRVIKAIDIFKKRDSVHIDRLKRAEEICFKQSQSVVFAREIDALKHSRPVSKDSRIINLNPFLDENGILRSESRISNFIENDVRTRAVILDEKETAVGLLIKKFHEKYYHVGHETVVNEIRQRYWVIGLRKGVRSVVARCIICKLRRARPSSPKMAALPEGRLAYRQRPFSHCGFDYFGPISVKIGRRREKRWGALYTCLTT